MYHREGTKTFEAGHIGIGRGIGCQDRGIGFLPNLYLYAALAAMCIARNLELALGWSQSSIHKNNMHFVAVRDDIVRPSKSFTEKDGRNIRKPFQETVSGKQSPNSFDLH